MKSRPFLFGRILLSVAAHISLCGFVCAASGTWQGLVDNTWAGANWNTAPVPGSGDTATFNADASTVNSLTSLDLGAGVTVGTIVFDTTNAAAYIIGSGVVGSQTLTLNDTGAVTVNSTVANNQLFNSNIALGTAIAGTTTITNSSTTNSLTFASAISGGTGGTAGAKTINIVGAGAVNFSGAVTAGGSTGVHLLNTGSGTTTLSGSGTSNFLTLRATTTGTNNKIVVNGQTVNVSSFSGYTGTSRFDILSGAVNFNGGLGQTSTSADAGLWKVSGGDFGASFVTIARNGNPTAGAGVASTQGLVVTGGNANITGNFSLGTNNSGSTSLVDGGALTVGGEVRIGAGTSSSRFNILEVRSGSLSSTDATNGIILSRAGSATQNSQLLLNGGTTTAEKITFGTGSTFAGSTGHVILNGSGASLYLGGGGIVNGAGSNITTTVSLQQGTLGAKADWSSSLNMSLAGPGVTIKAADVSNSSKNINLSGVLSGANGFVKSGGGTLTLNNASNTYSGTTTITGGTLALTGTASLVSPNIIVGASTTFDVSGVTGGYTLASGQTLSGPGSVTGSMSVAGTLNPGSSPGTMTTGSQTWLDGGDFNWQILDATGTVGVGYDSIAITGTLDLTNLTTANFGINLWSLSSTGPDVNGNASNFNNLLTQSWTILTTTGGISGFDAADFMISVAANNGTGGFSNTLAGGSFSLGQTGTDLVLTYTAVPEPAAALLGGLGMLCLLRRRRDVSAGR